MRNFLRCARDGVSNVDVRGENRAGVNQIYGIRTRVNLFSSSTLLRNVVIKWLGNVLQGRRLDRWLKAGRSIIAQVGSDDSCRSGCTTHSYSRHESFPIVLTLAMIISESSSLDPHLLAMINSITDLRLLLIYLVTPVSTNKTSLLKIKQNSHVTWKNHPHPLVPIP